MTNEQKRANNAAHAAAKARSLLHFVPVRPCKYGHTLRYVNGGMCVECTRRRNAAWAGRSVPVLRVTFVAHATVDDRAGLRAYLAECVKAFEASRGHTIAIVI